MKINICVALICFVSGLSFAGPIKMRNEKALKEYQAEKDYESSTNYYSVDQFVIDINAANNFAQLKAVMVKKANADKAKQKAKDKTKPKN